MMVSIAVNRFGLGARPGELAEVVEPRQWLLDQLSSPVPLPRGDNLRSSGDVVRALHRYRRVGGVSGRKRFQGEARALMRREQSARWLLGVQTDRPFVERLVHFWANHFTVSTTRQQVRPVVGAFEREVIREHALGSFADLLVASCRHPAMLVYLDNVRSVGPNSRGARGRGRNENLAREVLELHTLGVNGGYEQADVEALANLLTGWTVQRTEDFDGPDAFLFQGRTHEPGSKTLLGTVYPEGLQGTEMALRDLARHPSTCRHVCTKLARHFVSDDPPAKAVAQLERAWQRSNGDLKAIGDALVRLPSAWRPNQRKLKSPSDLLLSMARGFEVPERAEDLMRAAVALGQPTDRAPSPQGWPDTAADWLGGEAVLARLDVANELALKRYRTIDDPAKRAVDLLGEQLSQRTRTLIERADGPRRGLALLVASPEFQRR
ncbi:MAG: hypothetical protein ACI9MC_003334 [Kiritimatiellia bacterium]|jgi:uncharacterized protein (DUF1800 family)